MRREAPASSDLPERFAAALALALLLAPAAFAQSTSRLAGDYVCAYGCRLTDANPSIDVKGSEADCVNEYGGLFRGEAFGPDAVACFRKTGRLSPDGLTLTWSDGVIWKRHGPAPK
jgi:ABC-type oligopeptide transport system substrate-binding subunit